MKKLLVILIIIVSIVSMVNIVSATVNHQQWSGLPESPELTSDYPYQFIEYGLNATQKCLLMSKAPIYRSGVGYYFTNGKKYYLNTALTMWQTPSDLGTGQRNYDVPLQSNNDIFTDNTLTTVYYARTTAPPESVVIENSTDNLVLASGSVVNHAIDLAFTFTSCTQVRVKIDTVNAGIWPEFAAWTLSVFDDITTFINDNNTTFQNVYNEVFDSLDTDNYRIILKIEQN